MYALEPPPAAPRLALALTLNPDKSDSRLQNPFMTKLPLHLDWTPQDFFQFPSGHSYLSVWPRPSTGTGHSNPNTRPHPNPISAL